MGSERAGRGFRLSKYYLDCIDAQGAVFIGYAAHLRWGPVSVRYAASLRAGPGGECVESHTLRSRSAPRVSGSAVSWRCEPLGVAGEWRGDSAGETLVLQDDATGRIEWQGIAPRAQAEVTAGGVSLRGSGYVERLELTVLPWRLPFHTLYWGRFHSPTDVLYWIAWDGEGTRVREIRHNGRRIEDATFSRESVELSDGSVLSAHEPRVIHDSAIVSALAGLPRLLEKVPASFARARETKWVSRATYSTAARSTAGWLLHEVVRMR